jgi:ABC-type sugar transport system permease subunit
MNARRLWLWQYRSAPYLFLTPFVLLFSVFAAWPLGRSLVLSFFSVTGPTHRRFVGLDNYRFLIFHDRIFWIAAANTTAFAIAYVLLYIPLSLGLAILLNHHKLRLSGVFRFAFFSTNLVGQVFVAVIFGQLFDPRRGLISRAIGLLVGHPVEIGWLTDPNLILPSILIASLWLSIGFGMIYLLAALQAVDPQLYEAAAVDGAGPGHVFWNITLPGIRPVLIFLVLVGTISAFQLFELPWVLMQRSGTISARGLTIVMYLFQTGFLQGDLGYAAAIGWILVAILAFVSLAQTRLTGFTRATS